jgi:prepilin-type N-terminal cleavage/methylation domain-containing protein
MKPRQSVARPSGVTLLEMVLVMVILGLAFTALSGLFATAVRTLPVNDQLQSAGQLAQGCADRILSARRTPDFVFTTPVGTLVTSHCAFTSTAFTLTLSEAAGPLAASLCPSGLSCRHLTVSVTPVAGSGVAAQLDFLLAQ